MSVETQTTPVSQEPAQRSSARNSGAAVLGAVMLAVSLAAALSVDVVRTGFGIKGDEASYVAMTLSAAFDRDLSFERKDLERFWGLYRSGPEGIFLKRGKVIDVRWQRRAPFVRFVKQDDPNPDRLRFGKSFIYSVFAAPFVWLLGLNGFLVFHVLLLFGVCMAGYRFLVAQSHAPAAALAFALAFVGAAIIPVYAVFLTPEVFNFALVFFAYFLWLYKEVAPNAGGFLGGGGSTVCAAVLLALATYSKPTNAPLVGPIVALYWWRRRAGAGIAVGTVFVAGTAMLFGLNALSSGEFNYQGGDRRTFYGRFPFDSANATWENRGISMTTNDSDAENVLDRSELPSRFAHNVEYFLVGRHFGLVPYFFPGVVAIALWLLSKDRFCAWRVLTFLGVAGSAAVLLLFFPYSWSGGGGPPGNRYFLSLYPALLFLTPSVAMAPALLAWIGGALFTAKIVMNPFVAAKFPYLSVERGFARRLPVELTMANDLPVMLDSSRSHIRYGRQPELLLYFLDQNAYPPDPEGIWISGSGRADILVRTEREIGILRVRVTSPIRTLFTISAGGPDTSILLEPGRVVTLDVPAEGVRGLQSYAYLVSARSSDAFTPHLLDPQSSDPRNLGAIIQLTAQ
jgi:hypothetical protein